MAIAPTGAIYKALSFDNTSSRSFGVYITGEAVYNAPERDVEMIDIPGRNGAYALDNGRFQNIEVTYFAGITADTEADFRQAISDFRNFLCSKKGYVRLSDDYNPDEYRMAIYKSGLEVTPAQLRAGEFDITFECKPQRFLTSGESATSVANNGTLTNPTLFESKPLLQFSGYGNIGINDTQVSISDSVTFGKQLLANEATYGGGGRIEITLNSGNLALLDTGDSITLESGSSITAGYATISGANTSIQSLTATTSGTTASHVTYNPIAYTQSNYNIIIDEPIVFQKGTLRTETITVSTSLGYTVSGNSYTYNATHTVTISYWANSIDSYILVWLNDPSPSPPAGITQVAPKGTRIKNIYGYSTKTSIPGTIYIDLDIGEAYITNNGITSSLNNVATIPAKLPTLVPGTNTFTYDNTVSAFKVTPRWWKV